MGDALKNGTKRTQGMDALAINVGLCTDIADMVSTTLGKHGLDKMLVDSMGDAVITNDGATILSTLDVGQPASKLLVNIAKTQDEQCGDGTTTATILAGALLRECLDVRQKWGIHQTIITRGYSLAMNRCLSKLKELIIPCLSKDDLMNIAKTSINSKTAKAYDEVLTKIAVEAISMIYDKDTGKADVKNIKIVKKSGGGVNDSELIKGAILQNKVPKGAARSLRVPEVVLITGSLAITKADVEAKTWDDMKEIKSGEHDELLKLVEKIRGNMAVFVRGKIDERILPELIKRGVMPVENVHPDDMNLLERVTKARSVDITILATSDIGKADSIDVRVVSGEELLNVISLDSKAVSVMIRGGAYQSMDEIDRGLHDCLMVVSDAMEDQSMLAGGGSSMEAMAVDLRDFAKYQGGKEQLAIEAYADALESIPLTLARNGGMDALEVLLELRTLHVEGKWKMGVDYDKMKAGDMVEGKVLEPFRVVRQAIQSATEVAIQVIRVDDMLIAKPLTETHPDLATNSIGR